MPITYLDVPKGIRIEEKNKLVKAIYAALHEAYPYPDDDGSFCVNGGLRV